MANTVAATIDDVNVKQLNETLKLAMQDTKKISLNGQCNNALTTANYMTTQSKLNCEIVGMFNYLNNKINDVIAENTALKTEISR